MTPTNSNGRLKIPWSAAVQIAAILLSAGALMGRMAALQAQVTRVETTMVTKDTVEALLRGTDAIHAQLKEEDRKLWNEILSLNGRAEAQPAKRK